MNLEDLVPPLALCQKIPAGEFAESALMWFSNYHFGGWHVEKRGFAEAFTDNGELYPAPTLQEIMEVLPHDDAYNDLLIGYSKKVAKFTGWHIYYNGDRKRHCYDQNPAAAALKLWLKLKGIE